MSTIGFVGGGRITRIFLQAFQNKKVSVTQVVVSDPSEDLLGKLKTDFVGLNVVSGSNIEAASQEIVFLAVHPPVMKEVLPEIAEAIQSAKVVVSLAPVFTSPKLEAMLHGYNKLVRMIPNAASIINPMRRRSSTRAAIRSGIPNISARRRRTCLATCLRRWASVPKWKKTSLKLTPSSRPWGRPICGRS